MKKKTALTLIPLALILVGIFVSPALRAQDTPPNSVLALSKTDHTLAIVDPATLKVLAKVPVGDDPHEVIASTDGRTAYVSNYGYGRFHTITAIDLVGQKPLATIDLGALVGPHGLAFADGKLWFTAEVAKAIARYDPATQKIDWILGTGQNRTHMIFVAPDIKWIATTNVNSGTVSIIEKTEGRSGAPPGPPAGAAPNGPPPGPPPLIQPPGSDWNETVIPVGVGSEGFDVSPDHKELWAADAQNGNVSIVDIARKQLIDALPVNAVGANRLKFTPDGKLVLVSTLRGGDVFVIDTATRKVIKRIPVGHGAAGILMQPDGSRAFVACSPDNYVVTIDLKSLEVTAHIDAGGNPDGLAWAVRQ